MTFKMQKDTKKMCHKNNLNFEIIKINVTM